MMEKKLNLKEIIEMAIQIETVGAAFYKRLQELAKTEESRKLFRKLEKAEYRHIEDFREILKQAESRHGHHGYAATEEDLLYLRAFASRKIFTSVEDAIARAEDLDDIREAIDLSLDFELKSVAFYREMADMIEDTDDSASVRELKRQKKEHAVYLFRMREKISEN